MVDDAGASVNAWRSDRAPLRFGWCDVLGQNGVRSGERPLAQATRMDPPGRPAIRKTPTVHGLRIVDAMQFDDLLRDLEWDVRLHVLVEPGVAIREAVTSFRERSGHVSPGVVSGTRAVLRAADQVERKLQA